GNKLAQPKFPFWISLYRPHRFLPSVLKGWLVPSAEREQALANKVVRSPILGLQHFAKFRPILLCPEGICSRHLERNWLRFSSGVEPLGDFLGQTMPNHPIDQSDTVAQIGNAPLLEIRKSISKRRSVKGRL